MAGRRGSVHLPNALGPTQPSPVSSRPIFLDGTTSWRTPKQWEPSWTPPKFQVLSIPPPSTFSSFLGLGEWHSVQAKNLGLTLFPSLSFISSLTHLMHLQILLLNLLSGSQICPFLSIPPHPTLNCCHLSPKLLPSIPSKPPTTCSPL